MVDESFIMKLLNRLYFQPSKMKRALGRLLNRYSEITWLVQHFDWTWNVNFKKEHQETTSGKTETEFEIEKILDKRGAGRTLQYFVKWKVSHYRLLIGRTFRNQPIFRGTQTLIIHGKIAKICQVHWSKNSKPRWKKQNLFIDQQNPNQNQNMKECFAIFFTWALFYRG